MMYFCIGYLGLSLLVAMIGDSMYSRTQEEDEFKHGVFVPIGAIVKSYSGWRDPNAVQGALAYAKSCLAKGEAWFKYNRMSRLFSICAACTTSLDISEDVDLFAVSPHRAPGFTKATTMRLITQTTSLSFGGT